MCWVVPKVYRVTVGEGNFGGGVSGENSRMGQLRLSMLRMYIYNKISPFVCCYGCIICSC